MSEKIDEKAYLVYGGTNYMTFFDAVLKFNSEEKKWTMLNKFPRSAKDSKFLKDGRISSASARSDKVIVLFGGCSPTTFYDDFMVLSIEHLKNDQNFSEITQIM